jgi:hypothetical protein
MQLVFKNGFKTSMAKTRRSNEAFVKKVKVEDYSEISRIGMKVDS